MVKIVANIEGMMCGMCEAHMNDAIRGAFKVKKVESSHEKNKTVILCENAIDEAKLSEVVSKAGYTLKGVTCEPYEKKGFRLFRK